MDLGCVMNFMVVLMHLKVSFDASQSAAVCLSEIKASVSFVFSLSNAYWMLAVRTFLHNLSVFEL